jgi:hypothetical protein
VKSRRPHRFEKPEPEFKKLALAPPAQWQPIVRCGRRAARFAGDKSSNNPNLCPRTEKLRGGHRHWINKRKLKNEPARCEWNKFPAAFPRSAEQVLAWTRILLNLERLKTYFIPRRLTMPSLKREESAKLHSGTVN